MTAKEIAKLAGLPESEGERPEVRKDLEKILRYFSKLEDLDTGDIEPLVQPVYRENVLREDEVKDSGFGTKEVLFNAPDAKDDMIRVPRTI